MTTLYAKVKGGVVVETPRQLPRNTKQVSGFHMLPPAALAARGYYPVEGSPPGHLPWEHLGDRVLTVDEARKVVTQSWKVLPRPLGEVKASKIRDLKAACRAAILVVAPEFKQRNAALGVLSPVIRDAIKVSISSLLARCDVAEAKVASAVSQQAALLVRW